MPGMCLEVSNTKHRSGISPFLSFCRFRTSLAPGKCQDSFDPQACQAGIFTHFAHVSACCVRECHPSDDLKPCRWGAADDSTWLNLHIFNKCDRLPHVKSIRCIRFGLKVNSRCSGLTFFVHTQKDMGCQYMHKNQVSDC